jgi:hypothetical protein
MFFIVGGLSLLAIIWIISTHFSRMCSAIFCIAVITAHEIIKSIIISMRVRIRETLDMLRNIEELTYRETII